MDEWLAIAVLSNVQVRALVEGEFAALVGHDDLRVRSLRRSHRSFSSFLGRFRDAFGQRLQPAVLIVRADAPGSVLKVNAIASFRDAVALSTVGYNRALEVVRPRGHRICFSDSFWLYPWMLDRHNEDLIANTPGMGAVHEVSAFRGQSTPEMPHMILSEADLDRPLLEVLLERWRERYGGQPPSWPNRALFRSLNMANQAAQIPAGMDTTFYDVGRMIALWVSAFEILAHPGQGKSGLGQVYELLERVDWNYRHSRQRRYKARGPKCNGSDRRPVACWLYGEIHKARNDFLHGNEVTPSRLIVKPGRHSLFEYAAPLYRLALAAFLRLGASRPLPPLDDAEAFGAELAKRIDFDSYQKTIEKALLLSRGIDLDRDIRARRAARRQH